MAGIAPLYVERPAVRGLACAQVTVQMTAVIERAVLLVAHARGVSPAVVISGFLAAAVLANLDPLEMDGCV